MLGRFLALWQLPVLRYLSRSRFVQSELSLFPHSFGLSLPDLSTPLVEEGDQGEEGEEDCVDLVVHRWSAGPTLRSASHS